MDYGRVQMNTRVSGPRSRDDIAFVWEGPPVTYLQRGNGGLLELDPDGILSNHNPRVGDVFTFGPFRLRCTHADRNGVVAERI